MRTNIVLYENLVQKAATPTGIYTKGELIDLELREIIRSRLMLNLFDLGGKIQFTDNFSCKQLCELRHDGD